MDNEAVIPVKVAVRIRPFDDRERVDNAKQCIEYYVQQNQVFDRFLFVYLFTFLVIDKRSTVCI